MRVFVVIWTGRDERAISSVWATRETAETEAKHLRRETNSDHYSVDEWEVMP